MDGFQNPPQVLCEHHGPGTNVPILGNLHWKYFFLFEPIISIHSKNPMTNKPQSSGRRTRPEVLCPARAHPAGQPLASWR